MILKFKQIISYNQDKKRSMFTEIWFTYSNIVIIEIFSALDLTDFLLK